MALPNVFLIKILVMACVVLAYIKPALCQKSISLAVFAPQTTSESNDHDTSIEGSNDHDVDVHVDKVDLIIRSIQLAAQDINNRQDLLHGYQIQLDVRDTKVSIALTIFYTSH